LTQNLTEALQIKHPFHGIYYEKDTHLRSLSLNPNLDNT